MEKREVKQWITVNGNHIPLYDGDTKEQAVSRYIANKNESIKNKQIAENKKQTDKLSNKGNNSIKNTIPNGFGKDSISDNKIKDIIIDFQKKYANSDSEYGIVIDSSGKITDKIGGNKKSVDMVAGKDKLSVHNHPSGNTMFSAKDLTLVGTDGMHGARGAVIVTNNGIAIIQTGKDFKALEFGSRFYNPSFREKWDFASDKQCDEWLTKNQTKYNYKYTRINTKK